MALDVSVEFNEAAFVHHFTEEDIRLALDSAVYDGRIEEEEGENKYLVIGFDRNINPIEVMYNVIDVNTINVFHAMKLRKKFFHYLAVKGGENG